jgi:hypothetical protein
VLQISDVRALIEGGATQLTVRNATKGTTFKVNLSLNRREREYLLAGGKLAHTKAHPVS